MYICNRIFHLNTMNMVASQAIPIGEQMNDVEIAYNKNKQKIVIMTNYRFHNWNYDFASFFEMNPWANTTEMVWAIYDLNQRFYTSIDHANGPYYVAVSDNVWFFKALPNNVQNPICYSTFSLGLDPISLLNFEPNNILFEIIDSRKETKGQVKDIEFINNNLECRND